jgi:pimeloyl-ACP methyl ester carboxylesterase
MPEAGWPLVVFGHGTGGTFRSPMANGFAGEMAEIDVDGQKVGAVVLSFDQVMHGPRRGETTLGPEELFFNFANPRAAKGNVLQSVADWFRVSELARTLTLPASVAGAEVRIDPTRIYFVGHSQGSTSAPAFLALHESPATAIFSGAGGGLTLSLLNKTSPVDVASAIGFVLGDVDSSGKSRVGEHHPALNLIQLWFDTIEPLNFAPLLFFQPPGGLPPKSVLHVWGNGDTYVPDETARSLASAMRAVQAEPYAEKVGGTNAEEPPFSKTWSAGGVPVTGAVTDHAPDADYDGHFVMFRNPDAIRQARQFIGTAIVDGVPTVVP